MRLPRVIAALLVRDRGLVKTVGFAQARYIGDPMNAVKVFNEKEVDEIAILDIDRSRAGAAPDHEFISELCSEAFMPLMYGGGVTTLDAMERVLVAGVEKVLFNSAAVSNSEIVTLAAAAAGSSSVVVGIDAMLSKKHGYEVVSRGGTLRTGLDPVAYAREMQDRGAGEILLQSIERDGTGRGYDLELIQRVSHAVSIPVTALGGAGEIAHFAAAVRAGASAVAAGSMFVFHGKHRAVLITYPDYEQLRKALSQ